MYFGLEGNVYGFLLTFLVALRSYNAYSGFPIRAVWEKILYALPECIQVIIIHYLIIGKEPAIMAWANSWKILHSLSWSLVMSNLNSCTLGVYRILCMDRIRKSSRYFRQGIWWSICIDYDNCKNPHKHPQKRLRISSS